MSLAISIQAFSQADSAQDKVFTFAQVNPQFPGGDAALIKFIMQQLKCPDEERNKHIEGKVLVKFVVNEDGSVSDVEVRRSVSPGLDAEAVRIVKLLPKFIPGRQEGKPVKIYFNIPLTFKL